MFTCCSTNLSFSLFLFPGGTPHSVYSRCMRLGLFLFPHLLCEFWLFFPGIIFGASFWSSLHSPFVWSGPTFGSWGSYSSKRSVFSGNTPDSIKGLFQFYSPFVFFFFFPTRFFLFRRHTRPPPVIRSRWFSSFFSPPSLPFGFPSFLFGGHPSLSKTRCLYAPSCFCVKCKWAPPTDYPTILVSLPCLLD